VSEAEHDHVPALWVLLVEEVEGSRDVAAELLHGLAEDLRLVQSGCLEKLPFQERFAELWHAELLLTLEQVGEGSVWMLLVDWDLL